MMDNRAHYFGRMFRTRAKAYASILLFLLGAGWLYGQTFTVQNAGYKSAAPSSIPVVNGTGATDVIMVWLKANGGGSTAEVTGLDLTFTGTLDETKVTNLYVVFDNTDAVYDQDTGVSETLAHSLASPFASATSINVTLTTSVTFAASGWNYLYVTYDLDASVAGDTSATVGCEIDAVYYNQGGAQTHDFTVEGVDGYPHNSTGNIDNYLVNVNPSGIVSSADEEQGETNVQVLLLELWAQYGDVTPTIDTLTLHKVGTAADTALATGGVVLYRDVNGDGQLDGGDTQVPGGIGTLGTPFAGQVTLDPNPDLALSTTHLKYIVAVNVDINADYTPGSNTIGLELQSSGDVTYVDQVGDVTAGYVGFEYDQTGYIASVAVQSGNTFNIIEKVLQDTTPPFVSTSVPGNGGRIESIDSPIQIIFSEDVQGADQVASYLFEDITGSLPYPTVPFTMDYSASTWTATVTPTDPLNYDAVYRITVDKDAISDYATPAPLPMAEDKVITFVTGAQYPTFTEPTVIKNRIGTGANSEALIFVPEPPGGASARVSVQVFTTTGRLVRTFYKNVPHSTIGTAPISWDGTNDRGENLGPGMYFVQIRSSSYKRVLKVMIVR